MNYAPFNFGQMKYTTEKAQNFVKLCRNKDILCKYAYLQEILSQFFFGNYVPFELQNFTKLTYTTKTFCQCNSSETAQQNFMKLYS